MIEVKGKQFKIAAVIPSYKVRDHILGVIDSMEPYVDRIYVVDDCCPVGSGQLVLDESRDPRVRVLFNEENLGVGGAVIHGYRVAIEEGIDIIVKVDGDGQMDPALMSNFIEPIAAGEADYTKGNRFFDLEEIKSMPKIRLFGNAVLSFMTKFSSGYWDLFDPTNGYTAIHRDVARRVITKQISLRYFFETDMLFRLNTLRAVVVDVPMSAKYGDEVSNLKISKIVGEFLVKHFRNFLKRVFYNYYLRDMSIASIQLPLGVVLLVFGLAFGGFHWIENARNDIATPAGTIMIVTVSLLAGLQFILAFIAEDIASVPRRVLHRRALARMTS